MKCTARRVIRDDARLKKAVFVYFIGADALKLKKELILLNNNKDINTKLFG